MTLSISLLLDPLTYIYNLSIETGVVPTHLKLAKVLPIYMNGLRTQPSNYRPISMLSVFDKMLERIMYKRFFSFLDKHNILNRYQFGFRPKHSTTLSLIEVMDEIYKNLDNGYMSVGIFLDLQKAFDSVDHGILLDKLNHYGFRGLAHDWIGSYLQDRKQYVSLNGINSETENIVLYMEFHRDRYLALCYF